MLHELLSRNRNEIIVRCATKLHARHPGRTREELLDTIPEFLDELIKAERREAGLPDVTPLPDDSSHARAHGEQRFRAGYAIADLALDFGTISDVIGELAIEQNFELDARSYRLLNECIDKAIAQAISEYFALSRVTDELEMAEWVGSLGHELRNAISSALMAFAALKTGHVGMESRTSRVLERALRRVETLVAQTLAAAQLRSGMQLNREHVDMRELADDVAAAALVDRNVEVEVAIPPGTVISADPRLLESALGNLIQNAIKFTRPFGRVEIRANRTDRGLTIDVSDECGGLAGTNLDELFGAFVRGRHSRGVGLGLSITKQSIEAHGGHVSVRDRAPVGCVFSIWLPA